MFYHQLILTKKGLLGKVWLAAHWERKLTKAQVFETNIQSSVNDILHPKVKLALRTSGHLLLGIVRIYSKKAKYLLSDCNEVLAKLKLAFRPTSIDLPKSQQEARREAITLQHKNKLPVLDLEATSSNLQRDLHLDDMSEDELSERLSVARASRVEDITLKDDILAASRSDVTRADDTFGDVDFEDLDLIGDEQDIDIDLRSRQGERRQENADADFDDDLLAPVPAPEVDIDMPPPPEPERDVMDDDGMDVAIDHDDVDAPQNESGMPNREEGFALPPLDLTSTNKLSRRRRKLIVDEFKNLTGEQIKQQLNDPSDLVGGLDLAPPSTTIMQLREAERSEKTAMTTATYYEASYICEELTRNLHFRISAPPVARLEEFCDFLGIDMSRSETTQTSEDRAHQAAVLRDVVDDNAMMMNDAGPMPAASQEALLASPPPAPIPMARDLTPDRAILPGGAADISMPAPLANGSGLDISAAGLNIDVPQIDDIGPVASPGGKRSRSPAGATGKGSKKRRTQALEEVVEDDAKEGEDGQKADDEDLRMNPKTRQLFKTIQRNVQKRQQKAEPAAAVDANGKKKKIKASVMFGELIANQKSRKEVARRFYSLLVMTKLQAVRVQQKRPYADIKITAGAKFNKY